jgi:hypothetical protein
MMDASLPPDAGDDGVEGDFDGDTGTTRTDPFRLQGFVAIVRFLRVSRAPASPHTERKKEPVPNEPTKASLGLVSSALT